METPPDWALELARNIFKTDLDNAELDLMAPPFGFDADTAIQVYGALEYLHNENGRA